MRILVFISAMLAALPGFAEKVDFTLPDLDGKPGLELAACGFAGRLVVLSRAAVGR